MDHQIAMRLCDRFADFPEEFQAFPDAQLADVAILVERLAIHVLQHEVGRTIGSDAAIQKLRDVGMAEARQDLPFRQETFAKGVSRNVRRDHFHRHSLLELAIRPLRQINRAHTA